MPPRIRDSSEDESDADPIPRIPIPPRASTSKSISVKPSSVSSQPRSEESSDEVSEKELDYDEGGDSNEEDSELDDYDEDDMEADYGNIPDKPTPVKKSIKIKLNLTNSSNKVVLKRDNVWSSATRGKGKGKARQSDDDDEESDSEEEKGFSDASIASSAISASRKTARQRGKEMGGENGMEFQSLPLKGSSKSSIKLTEEEAAQKKSEIAKKRKAQLDKKLDDEKTETINRLLKKQVGRQRGKASTPASAVNNSISTKTVSTSAIVNKRLLQPYRYISSIKSGEYVSTMEFPITETGIVSTKFIGYPPPRPPLKTRRLR